MPKHRTDTPKWPLRQWLIELGVPTLATALGFGMMGYLNFWFGVALLTLGVTLFSADMWGRTDGKTVRARVARACIPLALFAALLPFIFVSAPLDVLTLTLGAGTYVAGTATNGVTWNPRARP